MTVTISEFPTDPKTSEPFTLKGTATDLDDGEELLILVDNRFDVDRPRVQNGQWESTLIFNQGGDRLIEVIASDQDRTEITLNFATATPDIISRRTWRANSATRTLSNLPNPKRITIHHTAMNTLPASASKATEELRMRDIQRLHQQGRGWSDIGYHYIIMPSGRIYEGRPNAKKGAHDAINDGFGVSFDGSFERQGSMITNAQFDSAVAICTQLCRKIGLTDPTTLVNTRIVTEVLSNNPPRYRFGSKNLPRICGHRDRFPTECPGMNQGTSVRLDGIRQTVRAQL